MSHTHRSDWSASNARIRSRVECAVARVNSSGDVAMIDSQQFAFKYIEILSCPSALEYSRDSVDDSTTIREQGSLPAATAHSRASKYPLEHI